MLCVSCGYFARNFSLSPHEPQTSSCANEKMYPVEFRAVTNPSSIAACQREARKNTFGSVILVHYVVAHSILPLAQP